MVASDQMHKGKQFVRGGAQKEKQRIIQQRQTTSECKQWQY